MTKEEREAMEAIIMANLRREAMLPDEPSVWDDPEFQAHLAKQPPMTDAELDRIGRELGILPGAHQEEPKDR